MSAKLRPDDRHAVDLVLDRMAAAGGDGKAVYANANATLRPRVQRLQRLLQLIDLHEASDPPKDLVVRTLLLIDSQVHGQVVEDSNAADLGGRASHPA